MQTHRGWEAEETGTAWLDIHDLVGGAVQRPLPP